MHDGGAIRTLRSHLAALAGKALAYSPPSAFAPFALVAIYLSLALTTFWVWQSAERYPVMGDEPHYLVIAHGLTAYRTLEQTAPYRDEFRTRAIYRAGFAGPDAQPSPANAQVVPGPHGLYNKNAIGLPVLLALPFAVAGATGAKLLLIALSSLVVLLGWKISGLYASSVPARALAVAATTMAMPLILASSQIYPDLPGGVICLAAFYRIMTMDRPSTARDAVLLALLAYLPWLHVKFVAAAIVLGTGAAYGRRERVPVAALMLAVPVISIALLAAYHSYAFGNPAGPFGSSPLKPSAMALMVLFGLFADQSQGFLLQNPALFVGVLFLVPFLLRDKAVGVMFMLLMGALMVPGALHDQYGGHSLLGRFSWAGAALFGIPTLYGLMRIFEASKAVFAALVACAIALQAYLFAIYTFSNIDLYRPPPGTWLSAYSLFYGPLHRWLPALYDVNWAFSYAPNFIFLAVCVTLVAAGLIVYLQPQFFSARRAAMVGAGLAAAVIAGGFVNCERCNPDLTIFPASSLPYLTGSHEGSDRVGRPGINLPGYFSYGPFIRLPRGSYQLRIVYSTDAPAGTSIGHWVVGAVGGKTMQIVKEANLLGETGGATTLTIPFDASGGSTLRYAFPITWDGTFTLRLVRLELRRL